jgi:hypothetical protein
MKIYMRMIDGINMTNASSGKILAKQYHPDSSRIHILEAENQRKTILILFEFNLIASH